MRSTGPVDRIRSLDGLRGLAALYVALVHAYWLTGEQWRYALMVEGARSAYTLERLAAQLLTYGYEAVLFFFVLSGFVIRMRYPCFAGVLSVADYLYRRLLRLVPVMVLGLCVALVLDRWALRAGWPLLRGETPYPVLNYYWGDLPRNVATLTQTLCFWISFETRSWGSSLAYWSLGHEGFYYLIYPVCLGLYARARELCLLVWIGAGTYMSLHPIAGALLPMRYFVALAGVWWYGVYLADAYQGRTRIPLRALSLLSVIVPAVYILHAATHTNALGVRGDLRPLYSLTVGLGMTGILALVLGGQVPGWVSRLLERVSPTGKFAYTLYVVHFPISAFISGWFMSRHPQAQLPPHGGWVILTWGICVAAAYACHYLAERPVLEHCRRTAA